MKRRWLTILAVILATTMARAEPDALEQGFRNVPDAAKPWAYWWWLKGNVTEQSITRDLEAMKQQGLRRAADVRRPRLSRSPRRSAAEPHGVHEPRVAADAQLRHRQSQPAGPGGERQPEQLRRRAQGAVGGRRRRPEEARLDFRRSAAGRSG